MMLRLLDEAISQSSLVSSRDVTPNTSLSQRIAKDGKAFKKPKKMVRRVAVHHSQDAADMLSR